MPVKLSVAARNARLDAIETVIGPDAKLQFFTGAPPADCAAADTGTQIAEMTLPTDWMAAATGGAKAKQGTWSVGAISAGTLGHFRLKNNAETVCHMQGTVTASGGGGDMTVDNPSVTVGQTIVVSTFTLTDANA